MVKKTSDAPAGKKKKNASQKKGGGDKERDNLRTPKRIIRRFALRSGAVRCSGGVYPLADKLIRETIDRYVFPAMRSVTHDARLTVMARDVQRSMRVNGTTIF